MICQRCGGVIREKVVEARMLEIVSRHARFGLDCEARPLLESKPRGER